MAQDQSQSVHSLQSTYREILVEHLFIGDLLRALWPRRAEVLKPQVDDGGYDIVVEVEGVIRHIQLKASKCDAKTATQKVHQRLQQKPSGCVIWIQFNSEFHLGPYLWLGCRPGERLSLPDGLRTARHTKGDSTGKKRERPEHRVVPKGKFKKLNDITEVVKHLFDSTLPC